MARPTKQGVDYFPLDVYLDDKFKFIQIKYKLEGFGILIKLLQKIYSYGYWYMWTEDEALMFADENKVEIELLENVVEEAIKRDIFNRNLFEQYNILTSKGIQKRYNEIVRRRKDVEVVEEYLLITNNFGVNADINPTSSIHNVGKSTQSKVKESKVNKSKVKENIITLIFEELWKSYPNKKAKSKINKQSLLEIEKLGLDKMVQAINNYKKELEQNTWQQPMNGSTFFNGRYVDYLDGNYTPIKIQEAKGNGNSTGNDSPYAKYTSKFIND